LPFVPGASGGVKMASRYSGRSVFSARKNSSVTSRSRRVNDGRKIGTPVFARDGADGIDVLLDKRQRDMRHVRRMLQKPA
jgi:hypothetical protein